MRTSLLIGAALLLSSAAAEGADWPQWRGPNRGGGSGVMKFGEKGKGRAMCVELETGRVAWQEALPAAEFSSPVVADGRVFVEIGPSLHMFRASPDGYKSLGQADLKLPRWITPVIVDGRLYLRTLQSVVCYDLRKP